MIEVELDDGTILEIDTTDQATAVQAARKFMQSRQPEGVPPPAGQAPMPPPAEPLTAEQQLNQLSFGSPNLDPPAQPQGRVKPPLNTSVLQGPLDTPYREGPLYKGGSGMQGVQEAGIVLGNLAGMPADLANFVLNAPGMAINAFGGNVPPMRIPGGSEDVRSAAGGVAQDLGFPLVDIDKLPPDQRMNSKARTGAGDGLTGAAAIRGARALMPGSKLVENLARPYDEAKTLGQAARPVAGDVAGGAGAAVALEGADQAGIENPLAKLFASIGGGVGGATGLSVATAPGRAARSVYEYAAKDPITGASIRQSNMARGMAQSVALDPQQAAKNIGEEVSYLRNAGVPDDAMPTTGLLSNDPGLIAAERANSMRAAPKTEGIEYPPSAEYAQQYRRASSEATRRVDELSPGAAVDPRVAQEAAKKQTAEQLDAVKAPLTKAQQEAEALRAQNTQQLTDAELAREQQLAAAQARETGAGQRVGTALGEEKTLGAQVQGRLGSESAASERLATQVGAKKAEDQGRKAGLYDEASTLSAETKVDPTSLAGRAAAVRQEIGPLAEQDARLNNILGDLERLSAKPDAPREPAGFVPQAADPLPEPTMLSGKDLIDVLPRLSRARDAATALSRGEVVKNLDEITKGVKGELNRLADSGDAGALKWREAESNFKTDFAPKYREGVGGQLDQAERTGRPVPPTAVAGKFIRPGAGGKEAAADLKRILGEDGEKAARDYVLADMAKVVGPDGRINPARLRTWIANREGMFAEMPTLRAEADKLLQDVVNKRKATGTMQSELETAALERKNLSVSTQKQINAIKANSRLTEAQKSEQIKALEQKVKDIESEVKNSALSLLLDADPKLAAGRVFGRDDPVKSMREIVAKLGGKNSQTPEMQAWKKALSDHLNERLTKTNVAATADNTRPVSFAEMSELFLKHEKTLQEVYSPREMNSLQTVQRIVRGLERRNVRATTGSPTAEFGINEKDLRPVEIMAKLYFGQLKGGGLMRSLKLALPNLPGYNDAEKAGAVLARSSFDAELAQHLLTTPAPGPSAARWNRKLNVLMGLQEAGKESSDDDQKVD